MKKILIVDDDQGIVDATKTLLEMEGFDVMTAADGDSVKKIKDNLPDIILLDNSLSGIGGVELANYLAGQNLTKNIPIILFSANADLEQLAKISNVSDFISKPFEIEVLVEKINKNLHNKSN